MPSSAAAGDHDLALGVVAVARARGEEGRDRLAQLMSPVKGSQLFASGVSRLLARDADRLGRQRQVGVEVLHAEHRPADVARAGCSTAAATRSIPNPRIGSSRCALLITPRV